MSNEQDQPIFDEEVRIREIRVREFQSNLPADLLEGKSSRDKDVLNSLSVIVQQIQFLVESTVTQNQDMRYLERRIIKIEKWKSFVGGKWALICYVVLLIVPAVVHALIGKWLKSP